MTIISNSQEFRNASDNATIKIERYAEKFTSVFFYRVIVLRDGKQLGEIVKNMLKRKPSKAQISNYIETL